MQMTPGKRKFLLTVDFFAGLAAFTFPLIYFPDKSSLLTQCIIGLLCASTILLFTTFNRLARFRQTLPVIAELYGPFLGVLASFANIGFLAFIYQEYLFSRYINLSAIFIIVLYYTLSRVFIFRQLEITNLTLEATDQVPRDVVIPVSLHKDEKGRSFDMVTLPFQEQQGQDFHLVGMSQDPWSVFESKVVFVENKPFLALVNGNTLQDSRSGLSLLKRGFDIVFASTFMFILLIPALITMIGTLFIQRENPFFTQARVGLKGKEFRIVKFRTFFGKEHKITLWGQFLRRTNLDEIPQLLNIFKGDMSIVGPRAELVTKMTEDLKTSRRSSIRPGLTGFWQLGPYRDKAIESHFEYDIYYLVVRSFLVDLIVILLTPFFAFSNNTHK